MAGDWIKMRSNLWDDPRISKLCDLTNSSEAAVIGALYWLWACADQHSVDGVMRGLTLGAIDRKAGLVGLGKALIEIEWLADHPEGVRIIRFDEHNGKSAKRRCSESVRKMSARDADKMQIFYGQNTDINQQSCAPREREENKELKPSRAKDALDEGGDPIPQNQSPSKPDDFDQFWSAYPTKVGKEAARKAWGRAKQKPSLETILEAISKQKTSARWTKDGGQYIPNPATWINQGRWADEIEDAPAASAGAPNGVRSRFQRTNRGWEKFDDEYGWYVVHESDVPKAEIDRILKKTEIPVSDCHYDSVKEAV